MSSRSRKSSSSIQIEVPPRLLLSTASHLNSSKPSSSKGFMSNMIFNKKKAAKSKDGQSSGDETSLPTTTTSSSDVEYSPISHKSSSNDQFEHPPIHRENSSTSSASASDLEAYEDGYCGGVVVLDESSTFASSPSPLDISYWSETDATTFRVRGPTYYFDYVKVASAPSLFQLTAVDLVEVERPIRTGMCTHPAERVQRWLSSEPSNNVFIFCVNIIVPGPPHYHLVMYYAVSKDFLTNNDSAFRNLAMPFFFGSDDKFCDSTFKLIPRIVSGNYVVKKAVGSKPTILGKKLKQTYVRHDRFFEVIIDVGSCSVAEKVVKLAAGYAKTLTVDMAFLLEGKDASTLSENIMGTVRLSNIEFKKKMRFVEQP